MDGKDNVVLEKIYDSRYLMYDYTNNVYKFIKCYIGGFCEEDKTNDINIKYDKDKKSIIVYINDIKYESNLLRTIYVFNNTDNSLYAGSTNSENETYGRIYELTNVSYKMMNRTMNIFLNENNELISVEEDEVKKGYACYESICYEINCDYNNEYYLNTAQYGKAKNALVKCRKDKESGNNVYEMTHCDEFENNMLYYENGSARNIDEAVISCTSNSCKTDSATSIGLPLCKLEMNGEIDDTKACINNDNSLILNKGQHCLYYNDKGKIEIYKTDKNYQCKKSISNSITESITNIHVYDVTYNEIDYTKIRKSHYGAIMYNCPYEGSCYQTYGYIVNNNNGFIRCSLEGCIYNNVSLLKENCEKAEIGSLVYNSGEIGICINKKESKSILKSKNKSFLLSIDINNSYPETFSGNEILININEGVSYITVDDSYILISNTNEIINNINIKSDNKLYQCNGNDRTCKLIESPENGYYYSYLINQSIIISCNNYCISTSNEHGLIFTKDQYLYCEKYFPGNEDLNILSYSDGISIKKYDGKDFILLNKGKLATESEKELMTDLYQCNEFLGNCNKVETIYDGWYVSGDPNYKAIKCSNEKCIIQKELSKYCKVEGELIYNENSYYICVGSKTHNLKEISGTSLYLTKNNHSFPNKKNYLISYTNYIIGVGVISSNSNFYEIPTCKNVNSNSACTDTNNFNISEGEYCILNNKIYMTSSNSCIEQFKSESTVNIFFGSILINLKNLEKYKEEFISLPNGIRMYYCKNGKCRTTSGYYKFKSGYICRCEYIGCEKVSNKGVKYGDISNISSGELIYKYGKGSMEANNYYYIEGPNNFPGADNLRSFLVEEYTSTLSSKSKLTTTFTETTTSKMETTVFTSSVITETSATTSLMNSSTTTYTSFSYKSISTFSTNPTKTTEILTSTTESSYSTEIESNPKEDSNTTSNIILIVILIAIVIIIILIIVIYLFKKKCGDIRQN